MRKSNITLRSMMQITSITPTLIAPWPPPSLSVADVISAVQLISAIGAGTGNRRTHSAQTSAGSLVAEFAKEVQIWHSRIARQY